MPLQAVDILAGPIVRRVEPTLVAVWVALRVPAVVRMRVFRGVGRIDEVQEAEIPEEPRVPLPGAIRGMPPDPHTFALGAKLHLGFVTFQPAEPKQLEAGEIYSYDLRFTLDGEAVDIGLGELGLLEDRTLAGVVAGQRHRHLALGYKRLVFPSFCLPPANPFDLKLVHGSCRHVNGEGRDALPALDEMLRFSQSDRKLRAHLCVFHGDQVYVDSAGPEFTAMVNAIGADLITGNPKQVERIAVDLRVSPDGAAGAAPKGFRFPLDVQHFPPGRRHALLHDLCGFSGTQMSAHLMGLGEVFGAYLMHFSNVLWPPLEPWLTERWEHVDAYRKAVQEMWKVGKDRPGFDEVKSWVEKHAGWRLVPPESRRLDTVLRPADHAKLWAPDEADQRKWDTVFSGTSFAGPPIPTPPTTTSAAPAEGSEHLARRMTPTFWASRHFASTVAPKDDSEEWEVLHDDVRARTHLTQYFYQFLPEVRRALANIAVYTMLDDHEITDDLNITVNWIRAAHENALGRAVIRNMTVGYALFQHWGNVPRAFMAEGPEHTLLRNVAAMLFDGSALRTDVPDPEAAAAIEAQFELTAESTRGQPPAATPPVRWHYRYDGPGFELIALDSRTRRGTALEGSSTSPFSGDANAALLSDEALQEQVPLDPPVTAREGFTLLVAATPVLAMQPVELLVQPILNFIDQYRPLPRGRWGHIERSYHVGRIKNDPETFGYVPRLFEDLLARLSSRPRVVILSGDVHYTFVSSMSYWRSAPDPRATRFVQLTSSALRFQREAPQSDLFNSDLVQRLAQVISTPITRLGWRRGTLGSDTFDRPLQATTTPLNARTFRALQDDPILVSAEVVPGDARLLRPPEWRWRMVLESDQRPDSQRIPFLFEAPTLEPDTAELADRLAAAARRHAFEGQNVPPRRWVWWSNINLVEFATVDPAAASPAHLVRQSTFAFDVAGIDKTARPYTVVEVSLDDLGLPPTLPQESP